MELAFAIAKGLLLALLGIEFKQYYAERKD